MPSGLVFDVQRFSIHDGPGIRTTVFLKGCPLACAWCHNPESQSPAPEVLRLEHRCIRCGACLEVCPGSDPDAAEGARGEACTACGRCVEVCPTGARRMAGRLWEVDELLRELLHDLPFYEESGGGVTFSGGEPLQQPRFLVAALEAARERGLHTAVDTCGHAPRADLLEAARNTDLFLYDLKLVDDARHREHTGVSNASILENLAALADVHDDIRIRMPIVPGVNDDDRSAEAAAAIVSRLAGVREIHLLPYHGTAAAKFGRLSRRYGLAGLEPPDPSRMERIADILSGAGRPVRILRSP